MSTTCCVRAVRVSGKRTIHRRLLNLGELNTTQIERWQRSIEVIQTERREPTIPALYRSRRRRSAGRARCVRGGCCPRFRCVILDNLMLAGWGPNSGRSPSLMSSQDRRGSLEWSKVIELLTVYRLCDP
jgi:hypothetical protein